MTVAVYQSHTCCLAATRFSRLQVLPFLLVSWLIVETKNLTMSTTLYKLQLKRMVCRKYSDRHVLIKLRQKSCTFSSPPPLKNKNKAVKN